MFLEHNEVRPPFGDKPAFDGRPKGGPPQIPMADVSFINRKYLDIPYASVSPSHKLDIYLPEKGAGPFPIVMAIHGGGFEIGDKRDTHLIPFLMGLDYGFAVISIEYRLSKEATFPAAVQDVKAAVRWIRKNQDKYSLDGNFIAACGGSAGGNLAAMLGVTGNIKNFDDPSLGNMEFSSNVQAVHTMFGPMDFLTMDTQLAETGNSFEDHSLAASPESKYLGKPIFEAQEQAKLANPATYIHPGIPPFFIQHGRVDFMVPYQQSVVFAAEIKRKAPDTFIQFEILETAGHGDSQFDTKENMEKVFNFLKAHHLG